MVFCLDLKSPIAPHWYYIGFGLARSSGNGVWVHPQNEPLEDDGDFGIEFSFRFREREREREKERERKRERERERERIKREEKSSTEGYTQGTDRIRGFTNMVL
jgi:hypothetical protein